MKAAGAIAGLLIAAVAAYFVFGRKPAAPGNTLSGTSQTAFSSSDSSGGSSIPKPDRPLNAPLTKEEETREEFARKRLPFYKFLRDNYSQIIKNFAVTDSLDTLDVEVTKSDDETLANIISNAVSPTAKQYGFRKVRFYVPNPPNSPQPVTLIAESTYDDAGRWNTFKK
jgi:hypothetical protein